MTKKKTSEARPQRGAQESRKGKKAIAAYFDVTVSLQLKRIGLEQNDRDLQDMLAEAINLFFKKYGKPEIAK